MDEMSAPAHKTTSSARFCVFDYDDTLMMTRECKTQALIAFAKRRYGRSISREDIEQHWGLAHPVLFENLLEVSGEALIKAMEQYEYLEQEFPIIPHPESKRALEMLQDGYTLVIVSSCSRRLINAQLAKSALADISFDRIYGAEDALYHKPSGRVFDSFFKDYPGVERTQIVYIGDSTKDMQAATEARLRFFAIDRGENETRMLNERGAVVYPSLLELAEVLLRSL